MAKGVCEIRAFFCHPAGPPSRLSPGLLRQASRPLFPLRAVSSKESRNRPAHMVRVGTSSSCWFLIRRHCTKGPDPSRKDIETRSSEPKMVVHEVGPWKQLLLQTCFCAADSQSITCCFQSRSGLHPCHDSQAAIVRMICNLRPTLLHRALRFLACS
jgi:hypothetical protein